MSDYMFMLESHLSADQFRVVGKMKDLGADAGVNVYLTGGAIRDMLGGFPVRDLDFTIEGNASKLAKAAEKKYGAEIVEVDEHRKSVHMMFPGGVSVEIGTAHSEKFAKSGAKPQISAATIHDDLRARDFTINAIGLSLNKASIGLPIDPTNGIGDVERKEVRAVHNYSFYDDPARMIRLHRLRVRLGFAIDERTRLQYENAREAEMLTRISAEALGAELRQIAGEVNVADVIQALGEEKLLELYSPALAAGKLDVAGLQKLQKARQMVPVGAEFNMNPLPLFLDVLLEKLNAKERAAFIKAAALTRGEQNAWQKLAATAKKLEKDLKNPKLNKASQVYSTIVKAPGEAVLYLVLNSSQRIVQDRIRNHFQKYLLMALEVTDEEVAATGIPPSSPKFAKAKEQMILTRLDARPKKVVVAEEPTAPPPPMSSFARGPSVRHAR
jgi:tRNA nucleotidyltransferase (CCA-adding enzyme)